MPQEFYDVFFLLGAAGYKYDIHSIRNTFSNESQNVVTKIFCYSFSGFKELTALIS